MHEFSTAGRSAEIVGCDLSRHMLGQAGLANRTSTEPERPVPPTQLRRAARRRRLMHPPRFPPPMRGRRLRTIFIPSPTRMPSSGFSSGTL